MRNNKEIMYLYGYFLNNILSYDLEKLNAENSVMYDQGNKYLKNNNNNKIFFKTKLNNTLSPYNVTFLEVNIMFVNFYCNLLTHYLLLLFNIINIDTTELV